ncbi:uncharacterized protein Fot_10574 [Forsythia ovata]|uniref:Uncharacterized protein n=1 Tax=Forsythia ovata TaxID=205694 RepID=A0ABD1WH76_9LAMI
MRTASQHTTSGKHSFRKNLGQDLKARNINLTEKDDHHNYSVELIEVELDPSSSSQSGSHEASVEVISTGIKKLEKAIHRIIVCRSTPDWLPFLPGHSYWVPPSNSNGIMRHPQSLIEVVGNLTTVAEMNRRTPLDFLTEDETMSFSSARGWPSSTYFIKGNAKIRRLFVCCLFLLI